MKFNAFCKTVRLMAVAVTIPLMSACGGGGSSSPSMTPSPNPTRTPVVAVQAEGNPMEGSELRIRAISDIPAPEGGLPVRVNVDGALPNDIDSSACTGVVCTVFIPAGRREAVIVITPRADSTTETSETWTIRLGDSNAYTESPTQVLIIFVVRDERSIDPQRYPDDHGAVTFAELDAYTTPSILAPNQIRDGGDNDAGNPSRQILSITGRRYDHKDNQDMRHILVQQLEYAALGFWTFPYSSINDQLAEHQRIYNQVITGNHHFNQVLNENVVAPPTPAHARGTAIYDVEGTAIHSGIHFFPDGSLTMNFNAGTFNGEISALGGEADDDFGDANAMVPDGQGGMRAVNEGDTLSLLFVDGPISDTGFGGFDNNPAVRYQMRAAGFFSRLNNRSIGLIRGRFHDAATYDPASTTPAEISGDTNTCFGGIGDCLHFGFLGKRR